MACPPPLTPPFACQLDQSAIIPPQPAVAVAPHLIQAAQAARAARADAAMPMDASFSDAKELHLFGLMGLIELPTADAFVRATYDRLRDRQARDRELAAQCELYFMATQHAANQSAEVVLALRAVQEAAMAEAMAVAAVRKAASEKVTFARHASNEALSEQVLQMALEVLQGAPQVLAPQGVQLHCGLCHHLFGVPPGSWVVACARCGAPNQVPLPTPPTPQEPGAGLVVHDVIVPAGVLPGQQVQLAGPGGQSVVATVPPGVFSGQIFRVRVPAPTQPAPAPTQPAPAPTQPAPAPTQPAPAQTQPAPAPTHPAPAPTQPAPAPTKPAPAPTQPAPAPTQPAPEQVLPEDLHVLGRTCSEVLWKDLLGGPRAGVRTTPAPKRAAPPEPAPTPRVKRAFTSPYNEFCKEQRPLMLAKTNNRDRESILGELAPYSPNPNPSLQLALTLALAL